MGFEWCKIDQAKRTLLQYQDLIKIRLSSLALNRQVIAYTLISLQLNPALRTPHHYGQFAFCSWARKALTFSLNSSRLIRTLPVAPSVYYAILDPHCFKASVKSLEGRYASVTNSINKEIKLRQLIMALFIVQVQYLQASVTY